MAEALLKAGLINKKQHETSEQQQATLRAQEGRQAKVARDTQQVEKAPEKPTKRPVSVTGALSGGTRPQAQA